MDQLNIRAVLVSHFPPAFTNETLIPKMSALGVEIDSVVSVERSRDFNVSGANLVICMKDYMSHASYDTAKEVAKTAGLPFIALTRKAADWETKLGGLVRKFRDANPPTPRKTNGYQNPAPAVVVMPPVSAPIPELEEPPEATVDEVRELLAMFEDDNARLAAEAKVAAEALERSTRLLFKQQEAFDQTIAELTAKAIDKTTLLQGLRVLRDMKAEKPGAFRAVLAFAAKARVTVEELLALVDD